MSKNLEITQREKILLLLNPPSSGSKVKYLVLTSQFSLPGHGISLSGSKRKKFNTQKLSKSKSLYI